MLETFRDGELTTMLPCSAPVGQLLEKSDSLSLPPTGLTAVFMENMGHVIVTPAWNDVGGL